MRVINLNKLVKGDISLTVSKQVGTIVNKNNNKHEIHNGFYWVPLPTTK